MLPESLRHLSNMCHNYQSRSQASPSCLLGKQQPVNVNTFNPAEFEQSLLIPTSQIIERHDYRTILDFLLIKLRTALDRDWLKKLPLLHNVNFIPVIQNIVTGPISTTFLFSSEHSPPGIFRRGS